MASHPKFYLGNSLLVAELFGHDRRSANNPQYQWPQRTGVLSDCGLIASPLVSKSAWGEPSGYGRPPSTVSAICGEPAQIINTSKSHHFSSQSFFTWEVKADWVRNRK